VKWEGGAGEGGREGSLKGEFNGGREGGKEGGREGRRTYLEQTPALDALVELNRRKVGRQLFCREAGRKEGREG